MQHCVKIATVFEFLQAAVRIESEMKKLLIVLLVVAVGLIGFRVWQSQGGSDTQNTTTKSSSSSTAAASFDKKQYSLTDPTSIWIIANKHNQLNPKTYTPNDLEFPDVPLRLTNGDPEMKMRKVAGDALAQMFAAAKGDGLHLQISSAYRSYSYQVSLYNHYVDVQGKAVADSQSARPGFSEHQTGLAADVEPTSRKCEVEECFGDTPEGKWIAANAYKYGFVVRYPKGMQNITGYIYEPWHIRYIGVDAATEMHKQGIATLEQFFGLEAAPDYQ
jgi:D-alanyl-D-alanine carboxypeptidase